MTQASHFGVHWEGPIGWLLQGDGAENALGIKQECTFFPPKGRCSHRIVLGVGPPPPDDPLVHALLPLPDRAQRLFFLGGSTAQAMGVLRPLLRMSSPLEMPVTPIWATTARETTKQLGLTNVQPWVITDVAPKDIGRLREIVSLSYASPRTILFVGSGDTPTPPTLQVLETSLWGQDLKGEPWEKIGAQALRRHLRKEDNG